MKTALILIILILLFVVGIRSFVRRLSSGCCGSGGDAVRKVRVKDRQPAHYPYEMVLQVDGMRCHDCAVRVENALNEIDGVWAKVNLDQKKAFIRLKQPRSVEELATPVREAGYTVSGVVSQTPVAHHA